MSSLPRVIAMDLKIARGVMSASAEPHKPYTRDLVGI
jgi:hypothetical protein